MKILHIISSGGMYGAEAVILNLSRTLNAAGHLSLLGVFANSSNPNLQLHEAALRQSLESHLIPCDGQFDRKTIPRIRDLASQVGADVVHAHGYKGDVYAYLALRRSGLALVSSCHTWYDNDPFVYLYGVLDRLVLRKYNGVVAVSEDVAQRLTNSGVAADKVRLIGNGIDLLPFDNAAPVLKQENPSQMIVGLIGRLAPEKGVDTFIRAASLVLKSLPAVRFVVVGDGPDRDKLAALIGELNVAGSVHLLGRRSDMPSVYASLDIMVSSSRQEGLPMALLEGMASRLAVVATPVGEVPKLIRNEATGVLVPPDDPATLAAAILDLLQHPEKRMRFAAAARNLVETEYSAERMTTDYLRLYADACAAAALHRGNKHNTNNASRGAR